MKLILCVFLCMTNISLNALCCMQFHKCVKSRDKYYVMVRFISLSEIQASSHENLIPSMPAMLIASLDCLLLLFESVL